MTKSRKQDFFVKFLRNGVLGVFRGLEADFAHKNVIKGSELAYFEHFYSVLITAVTWSRLLLLAFLKHSAAILSLIELKI